MTHGVDSFIPKIYILRYRFVFVCQKVCCEFCCNLQYLLFRPPDVSPEGLKFYRLLLPGDLWRWFNIVYNLFGRSGGLVSVMSNVKF